MSETRRGLLLAAGAYILWGVLPLYFRLLDGIAPLDILSHRIVWSIVLLVAVVSVLRRWPAIRTALTGRTLLFLAASAVLIATNWLIYIWAVETRQTIAASLGYFINPLVNVVLAVVVLRERLRRWQGAAIVLAGAGVAAMAAVAPGSLWISLALALSFGVYGLLRKVVAIDALGGLTVETMLLAPPALGYLLIAPGGGFGEAWGTDALLLLLGVVTALPLLMFAAAARRLPYSTLALLQFIAPTLQFFVAVLIFGEPLRPLHALVFGLIWAGCALFAWDAIRTARAARAASGGEQF